MSRRKQSLKCRAELYAAKYRAEAHAGTHFDMDYANRWATAKAWRDGYLAARRDQRVVGGRKRK